tara:strand:+ start:2790 stop:3374 length:585 start_codon:yes stop_codon:yes gene_type:complete
MNLWYENPTTLINEWDILPFSKDLNKNINSLARLSILLILYINFSNISQKYISLALIILLVSVILKPVEKFITKVNIKKNCRMPSKNNPFMNFTVAEYIKNPTAKPACPSNPKVKEEVRSKFLEGSKYYNTTDFFNKNNSDRAFYTMPVTTIVNDQTGFAKKLLGKSGMCKSFGINCLKNRDTRHHHSRYYYWD